MYMYCIYLFFSKIGLLGGGLGDGSGSSLSFFLRCLNIKIGWFCSAASLKINKYQNCCYVRFFSKTPIAT
jgi:hypothetical protein